MKPGDRVLIELFGLVYLGVLLKVDRRRIDPLKVEFGVGNWCWMMRDRVRPAEREDVICYKLTGGVL